MADLLASYRASGAAAAGLAAAEARLATAAALRIALLGGLAGGAVGGAWMLATLAVAAMLSDVLGWPLALALLAGGNLLVATACVVRIRVLVRHLTFPALRAALAERPSQKASSG